MPCMCGDPYCPSCGPAQGFDPSYEKFLDEVFEKFPWAVDVDEDLEALINHVYTKGYEDGQTDVSLSLL